MIRFDIMTDFVRAALAKIPPDLGLLFNASAPPERFVSSCKLQIPPKRALKPLRGGLRNVMSREVWSYGEAGDSLYDSQ